MAKTVSEIYREYKIFPRLQDHMLRVAAIASLICDNFEETLPKENMITACLLHDMGNIIKAELTLFPDFWQPEGVEYWQKVKDEYLKKYGNEHIATEVIAKEIGISEKSFSYLQTIGFSKCRQNELDKKFDNKICNYADMRVGPHGVMPMRERQLESHKRYQGRNQDISSADTFGSFLQSAQNMENQIFVRCKIKPEDITDEAVEPIIKKLRDFVIK